MVAKSCRRSTTHAWGVALYCECTVQWIVCSLCDNQRVPIRNAKQTSYHNCAKHSNKMVGVKTSKTSQPPPKKKVRTESPSAAGKSDSSDNADSDDEERKHEDERSDSSAIMVDSEEDEQDDVVARKKDHKNKKCPTTTSETDFAGNANSSAYFQAERRNRHGGLREIVSKSQFGCVTMAEEISTSDVKYVTELAHFSHNLSRGQREHLAKVLAMTVEKVRHDDSEATKRPWTCAVPTSYLEIRRQYTGYPESFLNQLPSPRVKRVGQFGYVSLRECVHNFLAHGYDLPPIPTEPTSNDDSTTVSHVTESSHCRKRQKEIEKMYQSPCLVLWITEWSDGYDPHGFSKKNRGSAWVKVVTFVPPKTMTNSVLYTYPIALGPSTADPDVAEATFRDELLGLSDPLHPSGNQFYYGKTKEFVQVHVELVVSLMDQPERRAALHLIRGNSTNGPRWGYVASLIPTKDSLIPCSVCSGRLFKNDQLWDEDPCTACAQWNMDREDEMLDWEASPDFPCSAMYNENEKHHMKKLTFPMLRDAIKIAGENMTEGHWSKANVEAYLADFCVGTKMIAQIVTKSENIRMWKKAEAEKLQKPDEFELLSEMVANNSSDFEPVDCPPLWDRGVELHQHIDAVMHLVFLGAVNGTLLFIHTWLKQHSLYAPFMRGVEQRLAGVKKLNLHWLKAMLYKGDKLGGWVSENYLAFARVCKWFFLALDDVAPDDEFVEPTKPPNKWTVPENRAWLRVRGLDESGFAPVLKERVKGFMSQKGAPPPPTAGPSGRDH